MNRGPRASAGFEHGTSQGKGATKRFVFQVATPLVLQPRRKDTVRVGDASSEAGHRKGQDPAMIKESLGGV